MRIVMLEPPPGFLEERRRTGADSRDEMWEGVLHMVPTPEAENTGFAGRLFLVLGPVATSLGLESRMEAGLHAPGAAKNDYRVPDMMFSEPGSVVRRRVVRAALVVEVLSPSDESAEKLPFYAARGVREALYVDPSTRAFELFALRGKKLVTVPKKKGVAHAKALGVTFQTIAGPRLRVSWAGGSAEI